MSRSTDARGVGIGTLRGASADVLVAAIDAGVDLIDTADVYEGAEVAVAAARGLRPAARVTVIAKGGLLREGAAWRPDGRARHLAEAARASAARLGATPDLYVLHAIDPKVALATSVGALVRLHDEGVVRAIGVGNLGRGALEEALAIAPAIAAVEVELSPRRIDAVRGGLVALCAERGITVIAHRPLGGPEGARRLAHDAEVVAIAARHGATPAEVAIAWLRRLAPVVVPIPGASRIETAVSAARAARLVLDDDAMRALDARWLGVIAHGAAHRRDGEVVLVMGMPGAGKTTAVEGEVVRGALRLNRDERGGTLDQLARALDDALAGGAARVVLDNTYPTRSSRAPVIAAARRHGVTVRCVWLDTAIEDAQVNAVERMLDRHGRLLEPEEQKRASRTDPNLIAPGVQFRWRRELEPPALDEGFDAVEVVPFARRPSGGTRRGLIVELGAIDPPPDVLARWRDAGWAIAATAWRPGGEVPVLDGVEVAWCAHPGGPPVCWCRKPLPGLGLVLARRLDLDRSASIHVGRGAADRGFAARLGLRLVDPDEWLAMAPPG